MDMLTIISILISLSAIFSFINYRYFRLPRTIGLMLFIVLERIVAGDPGTSVGQSALLFAKEAFGGILIGLAIGWIAYQMLKRVDNYQVEILITLGLVMGGYDLAHVLNTSGPLASVAAGLLIIPLVLLVRPVSVGIPFGLLGRHLPSRKNAIKTLTWGGLRGGIAVALALSIPPDLQLTRRFIIDL
jgi:NhaP-type Na+/H+ or K+/H+ antiporter